MLYGRHRSAYHRYYYFTLYALAALTLQCCGSGLTRSENDHLEVSLQLPSGEEPSLFWFGVVKQTLSWKPEKGPVLNSVWSPGVKVDWEPKRGDKLEFIGTDEAGRVLVTGAAEVSEEKKVTIPIRRVL